MFYYFLLVAINVIDKMQKAISNKIQLGETLNLLDDYGGVSSINDERTVESLIGKVDKVCSFMKIGKVDGDLSRYFPNILLITRQSQITDELPRKAYASVTYSDKKQLVFILDLTASTIVTIVLWKDVYHLNLLKKVIKLCKWMHKWWRWIIFLDIGLLILI